MLARSTCHLAEQDAIFPFTVSSWRNPEQAAAYRTQVMIIQSRPAVSNPTRSARQQKLKLMRSQLPERQQLAGDVNVHPSYNRLPSGPKKRSPVMVDGGAHHNPIRAGHIRLKVWRPGNER